MASFSGGRLAYETILSCVSCALNHMFAHVVVGQAGGVPNKVHIGSRHCGNSVVLTTFFHEDATPGCFAVWANKHQSANACTNTSVATIHQVTLRSPQLWLKPRAGLAKWVPLLHWSPCSQLRGNSWPVIKEWELPEKPNARLDGPDLTQQQYSLWPIEGDKAISKGNEQPTCCFKNHPRHNTYRTSSLDTLYSFKMHAQKLQAVQIQWSELHMAQAPSFGLQ